MVSWYLCSEIACSMAAFNPSGPVASRASAFTVARKESAISTMAASVRCAEFCRRKKYVAKAIATNTQVNTAVYHKVRRTRTELNIAPIPRAAGFAFRSLHGLPQAYNQHRDECSGEVWKNRHRSCGGFGSRTLRSGLKKDRTPRPIHARQSLRGLLHGPHFAPGIRAMRTPSKSAKWPSPPRVTFCPTVSTTRSATISFAGNNPPVRLNQRTQTGKQLPEFKRLR